MIARIQLMKCLLAACILLIMQQAGHGFMIRKYPSILQVHSPTLRNPPINAKNFMMRSDYSSFMLGNAETIEDLDAAAQTTATAVSAMKSNILDTEIVGRIIEKLADTPFFIIVPILAGLLVSGGIGYFFYSWSQVNDD